MYRRIVDIEKNLDEAIFLFGARQTGKSTLLKERFADALTFDLLNNDLQKRFRMNISLYKNWWPICTTLTPHNAYPISEPIAVWE